MAAINRANLNFTSFFYPFVHPEHPAETGRNLTAKVSRIEQGLALYWRIITQNKANTITSLHLFSLHPIIQKQ